ncbi:PRC-barrel domain-containing protein [Clostridium guangxiense]|uniref:PRC-barrel domain-containing protein n=1 Tax=Clostridium guangxiense TaxID=1662055 RepID=UPI001E34D68F|nr:PRC-barrel domain-containing protein [Clostridium guangxiense]MCD2346079.1 PRC-barrel domain-containing protein [Clostridium guangxiense]
MMRSRDFMFANAYSVDGKRIGRIEDLLLNFNDGTIEGFRINKGSIFNKSICISKDNVICISSKLIVREEEFRGEFVEFKNIKGMETINVDGLILGVVEEIIFDEMNLKIKGLIISKGIFDNIISGKKIILQGNYIIGKNNLLCLAKQEKFNFVRIFHNIAMEVDKNEKNI